jgi:hypothetical protein
MDKIEYEKYKFMSDSKRIVKIPKEYLCKANELVGMALNSKSVGEFTKKIIADPYFLARYITPITEELVRAKKGTPEAFVMEDRIFFATCLEMSYDDLIGKEDEERIEVMKNNELIKRTLEDFN